MRKAGLLVLLLLVVAAAWSALWLYAARDAGTRVDAWLASEPARGRSWTCPNRQIGGYPFALSISCDDPTYVGQAMGQQVEAKLARLDARLTLFHPSEIALALRPPFAFRSSDGSTDVTATWQSLAASLGTLPDIDALSLHGLAVAIDGTFGPGGKAASKAAGLDARFAHQPGANPTLTFDVAVQGTAIPALDAFVGSAAPTDVSLAGRLDRADIAGARTPEEAMERWRQAGGHVDLARSRVSRVSTSVSASGTLRLDEAHRVAGRLDAEFVGLEPILARYGISGNLAAVGSLVSTLFGGGAPRQAPATPGALALPISFRNGRLGIGPITTNVRLTPLY